MSPPADSYSVSWTKCTQVIPKLFLCGGLDAHVAADGMVRAGFACLPGPATTIEFDNKTDAKLRNETGVGIVMAAALGFIDVFVGPDMEAAQRAALNFIIPAVMTVNGSVMRNLTASFGEDAEAKGYRMCLKVVEEGLGFAAPAQVVPAPAAPAPAPPQPAAPAPPQPAAPAPAPKPATPARAPPKLAPARAPKPAAPASGSQKTTLIDITDQEKAGVRAGAKRTCEYVDLVNSDDEEAEEEDRRGGSDSDSDAESENSAKFTDDEEGEYSGSESESDADMDEDDEPVMPTKTNTKSTTSSPSKLVPSKIARVGELPDNRLNNAAPHSSSPKDGTFDRISKTYALAQNAGTEEEALHAHRLLAKLLATHNIELSELQKEAQAEGKKTPSITDNRGEAVVEIIPNPDCIRAITTIKAEHWAGELARHVADLFHVRVLEGYGRRGEPILRYYFYGLTENIITAAQLFAICYNQASSWAYVMLGRREITGKRSVRSYCSGFAEAIHDSVKAHLELERNAAAGDKVAEYQEGGDLQLAVWKSTGDYEQFRAMAKLACDLAISDCKVKAVPRTTSQLVDSSAFDKGRRDGKTVNLKKQRTE